MGACFARYQRQSIGLDKDMKPASKAHEAQALVAEGQAAGWYGFTYTLSFAFQCVVNEYISDLKEIDMQHYSISFKDDSILIFKECQISKWGYDLKIVELSKTL